MGEALPTYRLKARNTWEPGGENKIHDDAVARAHGFRGGLVPGVTVYAYLTHAVVQGLGPAWLARGTADVRFVKPVFDGDEVTVSGEITARDPAGLTARAAVATQDGECAVATITLPAGTPTPVNPALYRAAPLPAERPLVSREHLASLDVLGTPQVVHDEAAAAEYLDKVGETLALYRGPDGHVHPAFYLVQANRALTLNVRVSPWIHAASRVRHLGPARVGEALATRGKVRSLYEKKGRQFAEMDLLIVAGPRARPVAHVLHTAIYSLPTGPAPARDSRSTAS